MNHLIQIGPSECESFDLYRSVNHLIQIEALAHIANLILLNSRKHQTIKAVQLSKQRNKVYTNTNHLSK